MRNPESLIRELRSKTAYTTPITRFPMVQAVVPDQPERLCKNAEPHGPISILDRVTMAKEQAEAEAILEVLKATRWNRKEAAALLNIEYKALLYKMKKLSIEDKGSSFPTMSSGSTGGFPVPRH
jgi:DNA-binding NtrC family response regulator